MIPQISLVCFVLTLTPFCFNLLTYIFFPTIFSKSKEEYEQQQEKQKSQEKKELEKFSEIGKVEGDRIKVSMKEEQAKKAEVRILKFSTTKYDIHVFTLKVRGGRRFPFLCLC